MQVRVRGLGSHAARATPRAGAAPPRGRRWRWPTISGWWRANGWLGMMLGVRLWYGFYGSVLTSAEAFEGKVEELCRELGGRGQA